MFKSISKILITGFITLLPIVLTIYLLYWLAYTSEQVMGGALRFVLPNAAYFPGLGMIAGVVKDFHFKSMHQEIEPLAFKLNPSNLSYIYIY